MICNPDMHTTVEQQNATWVADLKELAATPRKEWEVEQTLLPEKVTVYAKEWKGKRVLMTSCPQVKLQPSDIFQNFRKIYSTNPEDIRSSYLFKELKELGNRKRTSIVRGYFSGVQENEVNMLQYSTIKMPWPLCSRDMWSSHYWGLLDNDYGEKVRCEKP